MNAKDTPARRRNLEPDDSVRAVERAFDVLYAFSRNRPVMDLPGLQAATGLARPTLYRLLRALQKKGAIHDFGEPKRFQLGYRIGALGRVWEWTFPIVTMSRSHLERLCRDTGETVALMIATSPTERMCALEIRSPHAIAFSAGDGYSVPMHRGASGRAIMAFWGEDRLGPAMELVNPDSRASFRKSLADVRRAGTSVTYGEIHAGAASVAAPIIDTSGEAVASICVFSPESRMRGNSLTKTKQLVLATTRRLSVHLVKGSEPRE